MMSDHSPSAGARNLDAIAKGAAALSVGAASLAVSALNAIPDLLDKANIAKIYAQVVQNGGFGAVSAGFFAAIIWGWAKDAEAGQRSENRKFSLGDWASVLVATAFLVLGVVAFSRLLGLANELVKIVG